MGSKNTKDLTFERPEPPTTFKKPWRTVNWSERNAMLQTLREFPSNQGVDHLRILVVGPAGVGKSAFITSVNTVLQGRNTYLALSLCGGTSVTRKYTVYKLNKGTDGSFFPFVFGDTMGLESELFGVSTDDIISILQGHMQEGYPFNPSGALTTDSNCYIKNPNLNDKVHCLVFVLPADKIGTTDESIINKMNQILQKARELGIPQVVIMSKVDVACSLVEENLEMIYRSEIIKRKMEMCSTILNIPLNHIFPVKNYHEEISNNDETDILILMAVTNIVHFANDFVNASENPWRQMTWSEREPMLQTLREFPSNHRVNHLRILLVGPPGVGKSAFITSVNTVLQGRNTYLAHSLTGGFSATCKYSVYNLNKGTDGSFFPFVFGDTMGLEGEFSNVQTKDISSILQGHMQEGYPFNTSKELTAESSYYNKSPSLNDKVHCLVFVLPADTIDQIPEKIIDKMKAIVQKAHELEIPQAVIMSKVDQGCSLVSANLKMIYRSKSIKENMEKCNTMLGVPLNYIFPVKNYYKEISNNVETDILILMAVKDIVNFANDYVKRKVV